MYANLPNVVPLPEQEAAACPTRLLQSRQPTSSPPPPSVAPPLLKERDVDSPFAFREGGRGVRSDHNWNRAKPGQAIIEFALVLPLLVLLIIGVFDLGNAVFVNNTLENAAREGARVGVIESKTNADICKRVQAAAPNLHLSDCRSVVIARSPAPQFNKPITVTVNYVYQPITPLIGQITGGGIHMSASSSMIVEGVIEIPE